MSKQHIKKNDTVVAISGVSRGHTGKVLQVLSEPDRALVEGMRLVKKALRKTQENPQGGVAEKEAPVAISNLMLYCPHCKKGVRARREREGEEPSRKCRRCGHAFDG